MPSLGDLFGGGGDCQRHADEPRRSARHYEISCQIVEERERAVWIDDGHQRVWLPKSQVEIERADLPNKLDVVVVPEWLAKEKGLI